MMKKNVVPSQYAVFYMNTPVEYTGYFATPAKCRAYLKKRYKDNGAGLRFKATYPTVGTEFYTV